MTWAVETEVEFDEWWDALTEDERVSIDAHVRVLEAKGPTLGRDLVDTVKGSEYPNMKELRVQHKGRPYRILFAFDTRRVAILLIGGDKTGNNRWYVENIPRADKIYKRHLVEIEAAKKSRTARVKSLPFRRTPKQKG